MLACTKPMPSDGPPPLDARAAPGPEAPVPASQEPAPEVPVPQAQTPAPAQPIAEPIAEPIESAELEWSSSPLRADLDGDGTPESIRWTCAAKDLRLEVNRARARERYDVADLIGCAAAVVELRPGEPSRQIMLTIDEHDEAGPDIHFLFAYRGAKLKRLWSESANLDVFVDGSWSSETYDCDDAAGYSTTTIARHRWDGAKVTTQLEEQRTAIEAGACADP